MPACTNPVPDNVPSASVADPPLLSVIVRVSGWLPFGSVTVTAENGRSELLSLTV